jgi:nucleotide-binding universal stress UspA family protein
VPRPDRAPDRGRAVGAGGPAFKRILCPVDFSEASLPALELALSLAQDTDASITVLHVVDAFAAEPSLEVSAEVRGPLEDEAAGRLRVLLPVGALDWCHPRELVTFGKPWREILRVAREEEAEVVVMGAWGGGALERPRFGLTAQAVSRQASCPVLTVRPGPAPA